MFLRKSHNSLTARQKFPHNRRWFHSYFPRGSFVLLHFFFAFPFISQRIPNEPNEPPPPLPTIIVSECSFYTDEILYFCKFITILCQPAGFSSQHHQWAEGTFFRSPQQRNDVITFFLGWRFMELLCRALSPLENPPLSLEMSVSVYLRARGTRTSFDYVNVYLVVTTNSPSLVPQPWPGDWNRTNGFLNAKFFIIFHCCGLRCVLSWAECVWTDRSHCGKGWWNRVDDDGLRTAASLWDFRPHRLTPWLRQSGSAGLSDSSDEWSFRKRLATIAIFRVGFHDNVFFVGLRWNWIFTGNGWGVGEFCDLCVFVFPFLGGFEGWRIH